MDWTVPRTTCWKSTQALVVISPAMTTRPVAVRVSHATRLLGSSVRQASRMASEIWSAILSGWPSVTDSEVNKERFLCDKEFLLNGRMAGSMQYSAVFKKLSESGAGRNCFGPDGRRDQ